MFECHITIKPVFDEHLLLVKRLAADFDFKVAELLKKNEELSRNDTFITGHGEHYGLLENSMIGLIKCLKLNKFEVWRYKIEEIKLDSKYQGDVLSLLNV